MPAVEVAHMLDLNPELPEKIQEIANRQGEDPHRVCALIQEFRDLIYELHANVRPMSLRPIGEDDIVSVAPYRDQHGKRLMFYKIGNWKPSKIPLDDLFRATLIILEIGSMEPQTQVVGGVGIFDLEGLTLNHCWHMSPSVAQKMISLMVTCMPLRTTSIHIINQ
uniref:Uncharacterized protein n=1 Tax=Phlebotomus papatasi TaxID=29031 RepID=A0A1B0D3K1_PHLPP